MAVKKRVTKRTSKAGNLVLLTPYKVETVVEHEQRKYLYSPFDHTSDMLAGDYDAGATIYKSLAEASDIDICSRVSIIRVDNMELGLMCVNYLMPIHNELDGIDTSCYVDENNAYDDMPDDYENLAPIVPLSAFDDSLPFQGGPSFGNQMFAGQLIGKKPDCFYDFQKTGPVVIIVPPYQTCEPAVLDRFSKNRRVYVVCLNGDRNSLFFDPESNCFTGIDETITKFEFGIMMRYEAAVYKVGGSESEELAYCLKVLDGLAKYYGVSFTPGFNKSLFIEKIFKLGEDDRNYNMSSIIRREAHRNGGKKLGDELFYLLGRFDESEPGKKRGWDLIDSLEGMSKVKAEIKSYLDMLTLSAARTANHLHSTAGRVLMFAGNPGTAKTTCAEALTDICFEAGLIKGKRFTSISGSELQAEYLGQSAHRVHSLFETNDVLFLDEIYAVAEADESLYSREVLAQLAVELERVARGEGNKLVIMAGYGGTESDEKRNLISKFMTQNPGIASRISCIIQFDSYTPEECRDICFEIMRNEGYEVGEAFRNEVSDAIVRFFGKRVTDPAFGNGRECRNLIMHAERCSAKRIVRGRRLDEIAADELNDLKPEDILEAISAMEKAGEAVRGKVRKTLGF